jgi:NAD(P)-dependent dehydrogenase (short-subunit alcohol dehydrogenase family)
MDIEGKTAIVFGGASGLGEATARRLAGEGADVAVADRAADRGGGSDLPPVGCGRISE